MSRPRRKRNTYVCGAMPINAPMFSEFSDNPPPVSMRKSDPKPDPIRRFEKRSGLNCVKNPHNARDWDVMSPKGIFLFTIGTLGEGIDSVSMPVAETLLPRRNGNSIS